MESILARALEYTLKYWLKSFSRDQFKLQGRTVQLSNLDINGDALHASMGLPPALNVTTAKVGKLEIILPYVSNVQIEPIVVQIDRLDLVLEENQDEDACKSASSTQPSTTSAKSSGYGFADKIADGMTIQVTTVNLLLETRGGARREGGAAWASPLASITMRNLMLRTTNENWQVVNLKEARDFSTNKKFIYVFKKLEWESLSVDLLPHPDMFGDDNLARQKETNQRDNDGAKRVFFGGERFLEGISGEAYITVQRTELNSPLGLEVQLHITEAVCPALSEPGLRAFLRFLTGLYVCLNRGDVDLQAQQRSTEAAGRSLVSIVVDHIFLCIKDPEFRLEVLMQSLLFSRASLSDGENSNNLTKVMIAGLFLRDTFSRPPCTLIQPSIKTTMGQILHIPDFAKDFLPPIYPLENQQWQSNVVTPLICLHSLQAKPSPAPPFFASRTVITCQPLAIYLQEESCLRISSFLADGIVVNPGVVLPDFSVNSLMVTLKELDVTVPLENSKLSTPVINSFAGARLHIENLFFSESPSLNLSLLNLDKDPACFCLWKNQPIDASQKKWEAGASQIGLSLQLCSTLTERQNSQENSSALWRCVEIKDASVEVAMVSADGSPLIQVPPPGGVVRVGVACQQFLSNTSVEQLFFVLDFYVYFGKVSEKIALVGKSNRPPNSSEVESLGGRLMDKVPCDTAASLAVKDLQLNFLESSPANIQGMPLAQFVGEDLFVKVTHRTFGGAIAVTSTLKWETVEMNCVEAEQNLVHSYSTLLNSENRVEIQNGHPQLKSVFWVDKRRKFPFLDVSLVQVIPFDEQDREIHSVNLSACISGVRLGGGINYAEALLHRFGILGPDGGPGKELSKGLNNLSAGPMSKLFQATPLMIDEIGSSGNGKDAEGLQLGMPDDVDIAVDLKDWLFALEGAHEAAENLWFDNDADLGREERCWHTTFESLLLKAKSSPKHLQNGKEKAHRRPKYPVELVMVSVEELQILKPQGKKWTKLDNKSVTLSNGIKELVDASGGMNLEVRIVMSEESVSDEMTFWMVENVKFSVKQPIEAVVTKDEVQYLVSMCKSEVDSMGRIAAGVLRLLKLEKAVGQAAIDQLSNLGNEGFDKIFTPDKLSRGSSGNSIGGSPHAPLALTVASLEEAVKDSQAKCDAIITQFSSSESPILHLASIEELSQKIGSINNLLTQLRSQI